MMDWSDLTLVDLVFDICFVVYSNYLEILAKWIKTQVYIHTYLKKQNCLKIRFIQFIACFVNVENSAINTVVQGVCLLIYNLV